VVELQIDPQADVGEDRVAQDRHALCGALMSDRDARAVVVGDDVRHAASRAADRGAVDYPGKPDTLSAVAQIARAGGVGADAVPLDADAVAAGDVDTHAVVAGDEVARHEAARRRLGAQALTRAQAAHDL